MAAFQVIQTPGPDDAQPHMCGRLVGGAKVWFYPTRVLCAKEPELHWARGMAEVGYFAAKPAQRGGMLPFKVWRVLGLNSQM